MMYSRTSKVLGGIQYTMNSSKTQVKQRLKSMNKRLNNLSKRITNNAPVAISAKNGSTGRDYYSTRGKERISNVSVLSKDFNVVDVFVNPANQSLFPWLSGIGKKYDLYHFKRLKFSYVPALPTSEEGNVYIGLDYNTLDPKPSSSTELCQLSHWTMNVVWKPSSLTVDLNSIGWLYTRRGPVPNADYKTYDLGRVFFATEGISFSGTAGYVEVEYDVEFKRRQPDYVTDVMPATDTFPPIISVITNTISGVNYSSSFASSSYSNSSLVNLNYSSGYFQVTKPVKALMLTYLINNRVGDDPKDVLGVSQDNISYSPVTQSSLGDIVILEPGNYYKIYSSLTSDYVYQLSYLLIDN